MRTKWVYLASLLVAAVLGILISDALREGLTLSSLALGLVLTALLLVVPARALAIRRDGPLPLWSDAMFYCVIGLFLYGAILDDVEAIMIGFFPHAASSALMAIGTWVVEARYSVRVYSTARAFYFVDDR